VTVLPSVSADHESYECVSWCKIWASRVTEEECGAREVGRLFVLDSWYVNLRAEKVEVAFSKTVL
jgi:hypothetical protein